MLGTKEPSILIVESIEQSIRFGLQKAGVNHGVGNQIEDAKQGRNNPMPARRKPVRVAASVWIQCVQSLRRQGQVRKMLG